MAKSTSTEDQANKGNPSEAGGVVDSAKQAASQAKETVSNVIDQAKDQAASHVDQQRQTLASGLGTVAQAFNSMGNRLKNQDEGPIAQYAAEMGQAMGGQVDRLAKYLQGRKLQELVTDVESLARRSPAVFLSSAFVIGLVTSRFLKSSPPAPESSGSITDPSHLLPPASSKPTTTQNSVTSSATPTAFSGSTPNASKTESGSVPGGPAQRASQG